MGRYSYSQPSSSDEYGEVYTRLLEEEAALYSVEVESSHNIAPPVEADDGIPTSCYCGGQLAVETAQTSKDPGRKYLTCENAADGECHIWKWLDVAVMEEVSDCHREISHLKAQGNESEQKVVNLEKTVEELAKKKEGCFPLVLCGMVIGVLLICMVIMVKLVAEKDNVLTEYLEELQRLKMRVTDI